MLINPLIDRFCESRRRWLIVTGVTFVVALVTVLPLVDQYFAQNEQQRRLRADLEVATLAAEKLSSYAERDVIESRVLAEWQGRTVDADREPVFRNRLVEMVRGSGCQLRKISIGGAKQRPWREGDNPVGTPDQKLNNTPFTLEQRGVNLSIAGSTPAILELLRLVQDENMISHARTIDVRPVGRNRRRVQIELELWCFALTRGAQAS